ncbi:MAG: phosphoribosylformimino-5-aminoimidazole carboxamide ribotide isomerase [Deltaproteobacteria bacterium]|nr:phosphoribosylformimino-5-aminoimidazole carboxamide ribotide isomerase [Deltaproteobacteria bacterium]
MKFRPCIDLHQGSVKQIVGASLTDNQAETLVVNFTSQQSPGWYANKYQNDGLDGGHVIRLGPGNDQAALEALAGWPGGMQLGGGINAENAHYWLEKGAEKVIVTSYVFEDGQIHEKRLRELSALVGKNSLVLDLSCRKKGDRYWIVTDRWQKFTSVEISSAHLDFFATFCSEFLIHAVDVEGKSRGIEENLVRRLGEWAKIPMTYAGGVHSWEDVNTIQTLGGGKIDFTVGSALDFFGGDGLKYDELVNAFKKSLI